MLPGALIGWHAFGTERICSGEYTAQRDALFAGETLDQIIADVKQAKPGAPWPSGGIEDMPKNEMRLRFLVRAINLRSSLYPLSFLSLFPGMETIETRGTSRISPTNYGPENGIASDRFWARNRECTYSVFRLP
jgi:hypothetical protein